MGSSGEESKATIHQLHQDVTQCLCSSLAVFYYSQYVDPTRLPIRRSHCNLPSNVHVNADIELVAMEVNELTYVVEVDHTHSIIRVSFRGSLTQPDWLHDFNFRMVSVRNPLHDKVSKNKKNTIGQTSHFGIHLGFRNYLFGGLLDEADTGSPTPSLATDCLAPSSLKAGTSTCKYQRILGHVRQQVQKHPEYKVQVSGHSMGGAISTLTAFCLAVDDLPTTCVSIASPRVGNGNFVRAVAELELRKQLKHLRIVNSDDIVTALPDTTMLAFGLAAQMIRQNFYLHVGMCLHMSKDEIADFFIPKVQRGNHLLYDWTHRTKNLAKRMLTFYHLASTNVPKTHNPMEYVVRLNRAEKLLQSQSWESLYEKYLGHLA